MTELSILIPARNEMFLSNTIADILQNMRADTEIITVLDGKWADPQIPKHERVNVVYLPEPVGQRAATNIAAKLARGQYLMKVDAHCAFDEGFDRKMLKVIMPDWTMVPLMKNLHAFDWVCNDCGWRHYQGPTPDECPDCNGANIARDIIFKPRSRTPNSTAYRFDKELHFQYWGAYKKRQEGDLVETLSLQGSCWMLHRDKYFNLNICDEMFGGWGQQGVEVACKTWLSGGRVVVNKKTWYAHLFRTQGGDFSFPYHLAGSAVKHAREYSRGQFVDGKWAGAKHSLKWLLDKFAPVPDWHEEPDPTKGIVYYTCNTHVPRIDEACRDQLKKSGLPTVCVSLNQDMDYGKVNITMRGRRGALMMHEQILAGLKASQAEFIFLCESDVLYHPSHFEFTPKRKDVFYYDTNVWKLHLDGLATWTDDLQQVSGICASRALLLDYYGKRVTQIKNEGFNRHYEPGVKQNIYGYHRGGKYGTENWQADEPSICIRHDNTLTKAKRTPDEFRNQKYAEGWKTTTVIPGWTSTASLLEMIT